MKRYFASVFVALVLVTPVSASQSDAALRDSLQRVIDQYLAARAKPEHVSAISLSISLRGQKENVNLVAGRTEYGGGGAPITADSLWQIGSNTKAFTAATILQLEAEGKLTIDQTVGKWLPQYSAWKNVTIRRLLNMTSGIPTYDDTQQMLGDYAKNPTHDFTIPELIAYVYPTNPKAPKPTTGYSYSNTNYLLAELIIEKAADNTYRNELQGRFLRADLGLEDTHYRSFSYPASVLERMPAGYFFNHEPDDAGLAPLLGKNITPYSVSWMQGAGGIVSTSEDLTRWVRALYAGSALEPKQRAELMTLVSIKTSKPLAKTSLQDPRGFGLGVAQMTTPETGTVWFYEGESLGFRMVHVYFPRQDVVIAFGLNSQPAPKADQVGKLVVSLYNTLHAAGRI
ncbi:MAG TPA: serine hydrolase domain-containing protein [Candidatus Nitrosotalea sp.]|nr:serine hydrolase domain-containing protein [Candidatus Nitrosotalea sp.]